MTVELQSYVDGEKAPELVGEDDLKQFFLIALAQNDGNIKTACEFSGISRHYYNKWLNLDREFADGVQIIAEEILDNAEQVLQDAINEGNLTATIFFLKCKAKERGYVERVEYTGKGGVPLTLEMNFGEKKQEAIDITPKPKQIESK